MIVIDASAAVRWVVDGTTGPIIGIGSQATAPDLFLPEVQNTALKYLRSRQMRLDEAIRLVETTADMISTFVPVAELSSLAWDLAGTHDHSPYDMIYLALAIKLDTHVVTSDQRFARKMLSSRHSARFRFLGSSDS
ncbi:type II toxin-antitoxin system VapC family toxin [Salinarimonas ramus]|uniref:PIN domain-containing protein n=1 Tax=Salinarimonas ramus TaxID=690164 RepID=A0A917V9H2_9HYPH|nr:type II toxin-antitoxin system VapC family toxin [Salinarimonas ramus]GGK52976.1 hypothetical protein GCM10011322_44830 [Salinarimonas ramus]